MGASRYMMQRLREVLLRGGSRGQPPRQYRPNELRLDLVRAERLRREVRRAEPASGQPARSREELRVPPRASQEPHPAPPAQPRLAPNRLASLQTRSGLRQAWLLKEILGPPLALRDPSGDQERDQLHPS